MSIKAAWELAKEAFSSWLDDYGQSMGAALAYYTVFSMAPLLLIVISVAGLIFGADAARGEILGQLRGLMGQDAALAIQGLLESVNKPAESTLATAIGLTVLLVGATSVFAELQDVLDRIWRAPIRGKPSGVWALLRSRFLSFGMILGIGFLLIVSLVFSAALTALQSWWEPWFGGWAILAMVVNQVIAFAMTTAAFAMIYKIMPRVHIQWPDVWVGAAVTALLFTLGKYLIGLYIGKSGVTSSFGAAGSLVVVLVWVYYSAQIFLIGAEFTWVYAHTFGSRKGKKRPGRLAELAAEVGAPPPSSSSSTT
ncbi:MAG: YihY/virulence factor BrkB family protein [Rubrivivax sp.]|nr:MAG: YihY/virulence factor BrkB family protein [Rubrivivax sp.]